MVGLLSNNNPLNMERAIQQLAPEKQQELLTTIQLFRQSLQDIVGEPAGQFLNAFGEKTADMNLGKPFVFPPNVVDSIGREKLQKMVEKVNNPQPKKQVSGANQAVNPVQPGLVSRPDVASRPTVAPPSTAGQQGQQPPLVV